MSTRLISLAAWLTLAIFVHGCAAPQTAPAKIAPTTKPAATEESDTQPERTRPSWRLNHVVAWVPRADAPIAAVAEAMVHVALGNARNQVQQEICEGSWVFNGPTLENVGPLPATAPAHMGDFPAWYVRMSWQPNRTDCPGISNAEFQTALNQHLPAWMRALAADPQDTADATTLSSKN